MGPGASDVLRKKFLGLFNGEEAKPTTVEVIMGRKLKVVLSARICPLQATVLYCQYMVLKVTITVEKVRGLLWQI